MKNRNVLVKFIDEIAKGLDSLSDSDLEKLDSGSFSLEFKVTKKKEYARDIDSISKDDAEALLEKLKECPDRESGYELLKSSLKTKKDLEKFAKMIDIYVMKQDKIEKIRDKIIEGVIGASIRSTVIQGKLT